MEETVKALKLDIMDYTKSKRATYVLKGVDEIQQILDDQLNILTMMKVWNFLRLFFVFRKTLIFIANLFKNRLHRTSRI